MAGRPLRRARLNAGREAPTGRVCAGCGKTRGVLAFDGAYWHRGCFVKASPAEREAARAALRSSRQNPRTSAPPSKARRKRKGRWRRNPLSYAAALQLAYQYLESEMQATNIELVGFESGQDVVEVRMTGTERNARNYLYEVGVRQDTGDILTCTRAPLSPRPGRIRLNPGPELLQLSPDSRRRYESGLAQARLPKRFPMCSGCHADVTVPTGWKIVKPKAACIACGKRTQMRVYLTRAEPNPDPNRFVLVPKPGLNTWNGGFKGLVCCVRSCGDDTEGDVRGYSFCEHHIAWAEDVSGAKREQTKRRALKKVGFLKRSGKREAKTSREFRHTAEPNPRRRRARANSERRWDWALSTKITDCLNWHTPKSTAEVARELGIDPATVRYYLRDIVDGDGRLEESSTDHWLWTGPTEHLREQIEFERRGMDD